jgi:RHS repeat-associated protein
VTVNNQATYRKGEYFRKEVPVNNGSGPVWQSISVSSNNQPIVAGNVFVQTNHEQFYYDADGNLTNDGRWRYIWDAGSRLVYLAPNTAVGPQNSIKFEYDWQGRRIHKQVWPNIGWSGTPTNDVKFLYDGWNLLAELNATNNAVIRSYVWGSDLSGTMQGAGGVGGLLFICDLPSASGYCAPAYDGNGNVAALVSLSGGTNCATYEYGPFGELLRATGPIAKANPFRFSTKYQDDETDLLYYGYRCYSGSTGRWLSRDPAGEEATPGLYVYADNQPAGAVDYLGRWTYWVHYWKTYDWSLARGFQAKYAGITALEDRRLDDVLRGHSSFPVVGEQDRHMYAPKGGMDSREWWYQKELENAKNKLGESDRLLDERYCVEAAQAFARGLHSWQDKSAHYKWPDGVLLRGVIPHPGWWDAYLDSELTANLGFEWWWHVVVHRQPIYDRWQNTLAQRVTIARARYAVAEDSASALNDFKAEVQKHCFCKSHMLSAQ